MVIGAFPYSVDGGPLELLERIRNEPADRPTDLEPTVPRDVETILLTCLQKDPARRYQTTSQLRDDLCRWLNGEPISATGDSLLYVGRMLLAKHRTALLIGLFTWVAGLAFGLLMAVLYQDAADGKTLAEQKSTQSQQENEKLRARIRELEARVLKPGSWVSAIQSANELSELSAEEGWQFISRTWPMLEDVKTKQQFLKAVAFSRHPWTHRGMQLGMLDPSPEVQSWAINYIRNFAFLDPAEHREDYLKWYEQHKDQPLNEAIASSLRRVAGELKGHISDNNTVAMERVAALIGDSSALRDVRTAEIRTAVADTGLADDLLSLTQSKQKELRRAAADALARLPVTEDFVRSDVLPMLESSDPGVVSPVARMLARYKEDWAKNALLRALERGVAAENLGQVFSVAGALSDLGDASVIPPMIAAMESNNEYITVYGVGYFGLSDLTGVRYDESHDGKWWREWWGVNKDRFSLSEELSEIPATPESKDAASARVIQIDDDPQARYMLVKGAAADSADTPRKLLLILPGGDGGPDFRSFTKRIGMHCTDEGWIVAQLIAPQWDEQQHSRLVWPTRSNPYEGMRFSTEEQALKVIADIQRQFRIDQAQIYTLAWSSAGPAAYAMAASSDVPVAGALIAMSVFKPEQLSSLEGVKGRRVYVLHSPQDFIAMRFPQSAVSMLSDAGAATKLATYEGGHGWHGDVYGNIRTGLEWLQKRE